MIPRAFESRCRFVVSALLVCLVASAVRADSLIWFDEPGEHFEECLPLGNGRMGATLLGGCPSERIVLNDITLWSGEPFDPSMNPTAHEHLPAVREALRKGDYRAADRLVTAIQGKFSESFAPLGDLLVDWNHADSPTGYRRGLDIAKAVATVGYEIDGVRFRREAFVSHPDQALVMRFTADRAGALEFTLSAQSQLRSESSVAAGEIVLTGRAPYHAEPGYRKMEDPLKYDDDRGTRFCALVRVLDTDGEVREADGKLSVSGASHATVVVVTGTSFVRFDQAPDADEVAAARGALAALSDKSWDDLLAAHREEHARLYDRVSLELAGSTPAQSQTPTDERLKAYSDGAEDPALEALYFQFGRYLLIASSRTPGVPANLQGLWNKDLQPAWSGNYTVNMNVEMNYWPAEVGNLSELHWPLLSYIKNVSQTGEVTARDFFACDGWTCCHNSDIWAMSNPVGDFGKGHPVWANWCLGGAWLATHLGEHYAYTLDREYLRDHAYPLIRGATVFCLDWLVEGEGGVLVTMPSTSPENLYQTPDGYVGATLIMATSDLAMIRELFGWCTLAAETLGVDEDLRERIAAAEKRLPPYRVGRQGQLLEWYHDWEDRDPHHRHKSHLFGFYPGSHITLEGQPALSAAVRQSLELRGDTGTGWSKAWKVCLWARLRDGDRAQRLLRTHLNYVEPEAANDNYTGGTFPNLWDNHPPFQIDGNFGGTAGIAEMLMQSSMTDLTLLPALPGAWASGSVSGLCARGALTVDLVWEEGALVSAKITSSKGGKPTIHYGDRSVALDLRPGQSVELTPADF